MNVENAVYPGPEQIAAFFDLPEEGPFVMVNLLKFKDVAEYADGSSPGISGREAYERYGVEVTRLIESIGGRILYSGRVAGLLLGEVEALWDLVALAEYPSLAAFKAMAVSPGMRAIEHHRTAGLAGQLNIRTLPRD